MSAAKSTSLTWETGRSMHERIKDIRLARTQTAAVFEHAHETGHYPLWEELKFIDQDSHCEQQRPLSWHFPVVQWSSQEISVYPYYED